MQNILIGLIVGAMAVLGIGFILVTSDMDQGAPSNDPTTEINEPTATSQPEQTTTAAPIASGVERREIGNLVFENIPEIPERIGQRMTQYQNTRAATLRGWDPNGEGILLSTRFGETNQLHFVESPGAARQQVTFFDEPVNGAAVSPNPDVQEFLFTKDVGGGEFYQVFSFNRENGEYKMLTDGTSRNGAVTWSSKGDQFAFYSTKRNNTDWDLYVSEIGSLDEAAMVLSEGGTWVPLEYSPNDDQLLVLKYISINESYLFIVDFASGDLIQVNESDEPISYGNAVWSKDGQGLYITSDQGSDFQQMQYYNIADQSTAQLATDIEWDVDNVVMSPSGDRLVFVVNEDGVDRLYVMNTNDHSYNMVDSLPVGQMYSLNFHPDGNRLGLALNTPQTPGDIHEYNLDTGELTRWTYSEVGGLNTGNFVAPELIHFPTFDEVDGAQRMIPSFYFKPEGEGPHPVIISIHGGPESQYLPFFSSTFQYWINELGIAVLAPNVRGSAGYGKEYLQMDNGYLREDSVKDIGALLDWIDTQPELDNTRVGVFGGSYGGYMVLSSMMHFSDRLAAGVDVVGISNFVTFLENTQEYRRDLRRPEYGDERDPEMRAFLESISPSNHAEKITKPLLVVQGYNDPRVPVTESEQMVAEMRAAGNDVWYLMALDEGHGFRKKSNVDIYRNVVVLFLETFLLN